MGVQVLWVAPRYRRLAVLRRVTATPGHQSRPELVVAGLIVGEEPYLGELPAGIDLHRLGQDDIKGLAVLFGDGVEDGDDVVVTGEDRFQLGVRGPIPGWLCLAHPSPRLVPGTCR
jgi:hypothetical protein